MAQAVADAFRYSKLVLATTTYNADIFPFMRNFIHELTERGYKNRKIGIVENGTWAPVVKNKITKAFENSKKITFADTVVTVHSALNDESKEQNKALAKEMK
jgi:flavorubredoxin